MPYRVEVYREETIIALLPQLEHRLPLSNLDLLLPAVDTSVFFCYKLITRTPAFTDMVMTLKASLAQVLVTYYPFAGEMVTNSAGEPEVLCSGRGVDFIEAYANIELGQLRLHVPDETVEEKLVPKKKKGVLCVQATELRCGGLVLSCTFDHRVADAYSANMFVVAWAETARSEPISIVPSFKRSILSARRPPCGNDPMLDRLFVSSSSLPPPPKNPLSPPAAEESVNRIYYIKVADIKRIQEAATSSLAGRNTTKLEAFTAYLWQIIAKGARKVLGARSCSMGIVVDGRSRLDSMENYFGNVLSMTYGTLEVEELEKMALQEVAETVHKCVESVRTAEHFLGLVDWLEVRRPVPALARVFCGFGEEVGEVAVVMSSGRQFPVSEVQFGWGRPAFGSYHFQKGSGTGYEWSGTGYVMPMPSSRGNGDWVVYAQLMKGLVEALEAEAGDIFHCITLDYIMLCDNGLGGD